MTLLAYENVLMNITPPHNFFQADCIDIMANDGDNTVLFLYILYYVPIRSSDEQGLVCVCFVV